MKGRLEAIDIPPWEIGELLRIAEDGFPLLNLNVPPIVSERLIHPSLIIALGHSVSSVLRWSSPV